MAVPLEDLATAGSQGRRHLAVVGEDGTVLTKDALEVTKWGAEGFPYNHEWIQELEKEAEERKANQTLNFHSFILSDGSKVKVESLEGKIGGLLEVCRVIRELLELPVKFPKLFARSPLRLRTGVLLYGPPRCGKTHIVAAAAACSLRYIHVKGPELLDKYIGASEKGVRDIFAKAAAAAPCILFFDEFYAIAPKRGHDNTGVTDRVVNQLLAEFDGVSAITGVFTFAATNRPDLIDVALLRPGRLDHLLFCDFPSQPERLDILRVLSRHLSMENDVDLHRLSRLSEGCSGAAVLSDAELDAVHLALDGPKQDENTCSSYLSTAQARIHSPGQARRDESRRQEETRQQTLESLLVSDTRDFVVSPDGKEVKISDLKGKTIGLYFSAH